MAPHAEFRDTDANTTLGDVADGRSTQAVGALCTDRPPDENAHKLVSWLEALETFLLPFITILRLPPPSQFSPLPSLTFIAGGMAGGARGRGPTDCAQRQRVDAGDPQPDHLGARRGSCHAQRAAARLEPRRLGSGAS